MAARDFSLSVDHEVSSNDRQARRQIPDNPFRTTLLAGDAINQCVAQTLVLVKMKRYNACMKRPVKRQHSVAARAPNVEQHAGAVQKLVEHRKGCLESKILSEHAKRVAKSYRTK